MADLINSYVEWLKPYKWNSFLTLTFDRKEKLFPVTSTEAIFAFRRLIQVLNIELHGKYYTEKVGHCYFPYVRGVETKDQGLVHIHAIFGGRVNWSKIIEFWYKNYGYVKIIPVEDGERSLRYTVKYVTKGGDVSVYFPKKEVEPKYKPMWYIPNFSQNFVEPKIAKEG